VFTIRDCYSECSTGTNFFTHGSLAYIADQAPIILEDNQLNTSAGLNIRVLPNVPYKIIGNKSGCAVEVLNPTDPAEYHKAVIEDNVFNTAGGGYGLTGAGFPYYAYLRNNRQAGVLLKAWDGDYVAFPILAHPLPLTVPGVSAVTTTVTGAKVGDRVVCFPNTAYPDNFILESYVSAADTVTVRWTQLSGAPAVPIIAGSYYIIEVYTTNI
jgi:hypothetical protein